MSFVGVYEHLFPEPQPDNCPRPKGGFVWRHNALGELELVEHPIVRFQSSIMWGVFFAGAIGGVMQGRTDNMAHHAEFEHLRTPYGWSKRDWFRFYRGRNYRLGSSMIGGAVRYAVKLLPLVAVYSVVELGLERARYKADVWNKMAGACAAAGTVAALGYLPNRMFRTALIVGLGSALGVGLTSDFLSSQQTADTAAYQQVLFAEGKLEPDADYGLLKPEQRKTITQSPSRSVTHSIIASLERDLQAGDLVKTSSEDQA